MAEEEEEEMLEFVVVFNDDDDNDETGRLGYDVDHSGVPVRAVWGGG